ncbi:hypothetical protein DFH09DRAFT_1306595 [Mycena vulgaris]|nr:hypothetical protein DFH09DRAFT_1306595 [Mycena vulgaris]
MDKHPTHSHLSCLPPPHTPYNGRSFISPFGVYSILSPSGIPPTPSPRPQAFFSRLAERRFLLYHPRRRECLNSPVNIALAFISSLSRVSRLRASLRSLPTPTGILLPVSRPTRQLSPTVHVYALSAPAAPRVPLLRSIRSHPIPLDVAHPWRRVLHSALTSYLSTPPPVETAPLSVDWSCRARLREGYVDLQLFRRWIRHPRLPSPEHPSLPHLERGIHSPFRPRQPPVERTTRAPAVCGRKRRVSGWIDEGPRNQAAPGSLPPMPRRPRIPSLNPRFHRRPRVVIPEDHKRRRRDGQQLPAGWMMPHQAPFPRHPVVPASLVPVLALPADDEDYDDGHTSPTTTASIPEGTTTRRPRCGADRDACPARTPRYVVDPTQTDAGPAGGRASTREALLFSHLIVLDAMLIPLPQIVVVVSVRPSRRLFLGVDSSPTPTRHPRLPAPPSFTTRSFAALSIVPARLTAFPSALTTSPRRQGTPTPTGTTPPSPHCSSLGRW